MQIKKLTPLMVALALTACGGETTTTEEPADTSAETQVEETEKEPQTEETQPEETKETAVDEKEDDVPREYKNALKSAENYISMMPFSEKGLLRQLTSDAGDKYPEEAAQYALENLEVDWNEQALKSAKHYSDMMPMSDDELKQQLTSDAGEGFTEEQAQYAIDNLE
mgnify:CR=1 FL=1